MADDNDNEFEEEFDFESEEDLLESAEDEFGDAASEYGGGESKMPPLPVLIGGGAAGVALIGAILFFAFGGEEEAPPPPEPVVEVLPEPEPIPEPEPAPDPWGGGGDLLKDDEPVITPKNVVERIAAQEDKLNRKIQALELKLNELLSKLSRLDTALVASSRDVVDVNLKLEAINQELKMLAAPPAQVEEEAVVEKMSDAFTNPTLTVHAIIPGRAWLKTRDGRTITVTEGDSVEGYGKVLAIDAPSGVVITSSGVMLR